MSSRGGAKVITISGEASKAAAVVRVDRELKDLTLPELIRQRLLTVTAELVQNVITHGGGRGRLTLFVDDSGDADVVEIRVEDWGTGIEDVKRALSPHYSTAGTMGLGLPGVERMVDRLEIDSTPGKGTRVRVFHSIRSPKDPVSGGQMSRAAPHRPGSGLDAGARSRNTSVAAPAWSIRSGSATRPRPGHQRCGDTAVCVARGGLVILAVADGMGHGEKAEEASKRAIEHLSSVGTAPLGDVFDALESRLRGSVGAAVSVVRVDILSGQLEAAGVGNVSIILLSDEPGWEGNGSVTLRDGVVGVGRLRTPTVKSVALGGPLQCFSPATESS